MGAWRWSWLAIGLVACGGGGSEPLIPVTGMVVIEVASWKDQQALGITPLDSGGRLGESGCVGGIGLGDLTEGAVVRVTGDDGSQLGRTTLDLGTLYLDGAVTTTKDAWASDRIYECRMPFNLSVPAGQTSYGVAVGERDELIVTADELPDVELRWLAGLAKG